MLVPAIDVRGGRAVRLLRGDFARETVYADSPLAAARSWVEAGARRLHVVDLDGAREGAPRSLEHLRRIVDELGVAVQYGGGLRSPDALAAALAAGAERLVLGTAAHTDPAFLDAAVASFAERVLVAVDVRAGRVSVSGWTRSTAVGADEVIEDLQARGVRGFIYTDVDRDGTLEGPDLEEVRRLAGLVRGAFVYSGGIASLADLEALAGLRLANLEGVVAGTALYERRFTVEEGQRALGEAVDAWS